MAMPTQVFMDADDVLDDSDVRDFVDAEMPTVVRAIQEGYMDEYLLQIFRLVHARKNAITSGVVTGTVHKPASTSMPTTPPGTQAFMDAKPLLVDVDGVEIVGGIYPQSYARRAMHYAGHTYDKADLIGRVVVLSAGRTTGMNRVRYHDKRVRISKVNTSTFKAVFVDKVAVEGTKASRAANAGSELTIPVGWIRHVLRDQDGNPL